MPLITEVSSKVIKQKRNQDLNTTLKLVDLNSQLDLFNKDRSRFEDTDEIVCSLKEGKLYPVFFKKISDLTLSHSKFQITSLLNLNHIWTFLKG